MKWGPLNKTLYIATNHGKVLIYDFAAGKITKEEQIHKGEIFSLHFTYDFSMLVSCSKDGYAYLLHRDSLEIVREFEYGKPCRSACISPLFDSQEHQKFHLVIAGGQDAKDVTTTGAAAGGFEMKMLSIIHNEKLAEIHGHFGPVHSIDFSPDGFAFASGAEDGYVHYHKLPPEYFTKKFE